MKCQSPRSIPASLKSRVKNWQWWVGGTGCSAALCQHGQPQISWGDPNSQGVTQPSSEEEEMEWELAVLMEELIWGPSLGWEGLLG